MRFNRIKILNKEVQEKGIKEIDISRLSNVVAFIGRNGSGKSRVLDLIEKYAVAELTIYDLLEGKADNLPEPLGKTLELMAQHRVQIELHKKFDDLQHALSEVKDGVDKTKIRNEIGKIERDSRFYMPPHVQMDVRKFTSVLLPGLKGLEKSHVRRIRSQDVQKIQKALSEKTGPVTFESLIKNLDDNLAYNELQSLNESGIHYLNKLPALLTSERFMALSEEKDYREGEFFKQFEKLKSYIDDFLGKTLEVIADKEKIKFTGIRGTIDFGGKLKLGGRDFIYEELSDGEKILFSYALLFYLLDLNPKLNIKSSVIIIDEPEVHLHADSELDLLNGLIKVIGDEGQLFIATHSLNILSHLKFENIFVVKDGEIKHPSAQTVTESIRELLRLDERIGKLTEFITSINTWAFVDFMAECFNDPTVIKDTGHEDPQFTAFKNAVMQLKPQSKLLLDFGAGQGRLFIEYLKESKLGEKVEYCALEPFEESAAALKAMGVKQVYTDYKSLEKSSFGFVVLCNVLHEIKINQWVQTLNGIYESLADDGYLMIIEARMLSKGETIESPEGFTLVEPGELKVLFEMQDDPLLVNSDKPTSSIYCAAISKSQIKKIAKSDVVRMLDSLEARTLAEIKYLRSEADHREDYKKGRKAAFLTQLNVNARIAKEVLDSK